jgi:hypothetical protein
MSNFFAPPKPGMIAYMQYIHSLDLRECMYLTDSKNCAISENVGITYCDVQQLFKICNSNTIEQQL